MKISYFKIILLFKLLLVSNNLHASNFTCKSIAEFLKTNGIKAKIDYIRPRGKVANASDIKPTYVPNKAANFEAVDAPKVQVARESTRVLPVGYIENMKISIAKLFRVNYDGFIPLQLKIKTKKQIFSIGDAKTLTGLIKESQEKLNNLLRVQERGLKIDLTEVDRLQYTIWKMRGILNQTRLALYTLPRDNIEVGLLGEWQASPTLESRVLEVKVEGKVVEQEYKMLAMEVFSETYFRGLYSKVYERVNESDIPILHHRHSLLSKEENTLEINLDGLPERYVVALINQLKKDLSK